ncbi:MAG: hypothetical protein IKJ92_01585 [Bacteroidaceae bacterium]|nr:hypothetical protein [Bacteroidaceae bacterium]
MPTLYDHISSNSKTAFRKVLRTTMEEQFAQATLLVGMLCKDMCGERIYPLLCRGKYGDIQRVLREIEATFANHALTFIQIGAYKVL